MKYLLVKNFWRFQSLISNMKAQRRVRAGHISVGAGPRQSKKKWYWSGKGEIRIVLRSIEKSTELRLGIGRVSIALAKTQTNLQRSQTFLPWRNLLFFIMDSVKCIERTVASVSKASNIQQARTPAVFFSDATRNVLYSSSRKVCRTGPRGTRRKSN